MGRRICREAAIQLKAKGSRLWQRTFNRVRISDSAKKSYKQFVQNSVNSCEYSQTVNGKEPIKSEKLITGNPHGVIHRV